MVQHLLIGDLAALFIVLGLTGPGAAADARAAPVQLAARARQPAGRAAPLGAQPLHLAPVDPLRRGPRQLAAAPRPARRLLHLRDRDVVAARRPAAEAGVVRRRREARLHHRRPPARGGARQRHDLVRLRALPELRAGRGEVGHLGPRRPGRGGQRDDDLDRERHPGALRLALLPRRQPQRREAGADRARRRSGGSSSTRRAAARAVAAGQGDRLRERILTGKP